MMYTVCERCNRRMNPREIPFGPVCALKVGLKRDGGIQMKAFFDDIPTTILNGYAGLRTKDGVIAVHRVENGRQRPLSSVGRHSSDGFNWGYGGSGPADLALSMCTDFWGKRTAEDRGLYQDFKRMFVERWGDQWEIAEGDMIAWIDYYMRNGRTNPLGR